MSVYAENLSESYKRGCADLVLQLLSDCPLLSIHENHVCEEF